MYSPNPHPPVRLSGAPDAGHIHLQLTDLRYLFEAPAVAPLAGSHLGQSGFQAILQRLKRDPRPAGEPLELSISAPPAQIGPNTAATLQDALAAHALAQIEQQSDELLLLRREMSQSLKVGGLFLFACLLGAALVEQIESLPPLIRSIFSESLVIAGWVGLWHPLELILYAWWPGHFRINRLTRLKGAQLRIEPDEGPSALP